MHKTKTKILEEAKKKLEEALTPEPFDFDHKDQLEAENDITSEEVSNSALEFADNLLKMEQERISTSNGIPIYDVISVDEMKLALAWPPTLLPIRNIVPYMKRFLNKKGSISILVVDDVSGTNIRYLFENSSITEVYVDNLKSTQLELFKINLKGFETNLKDYDGVKENFDFVFLATPRPSRETLDEYYELVRSGGYFIGTNYNDDTNIPVIKEFRRDHKISVNIEILESGAWFWQKEDFLDRLESTPKPTIVSFEEKLKQMAQSQSSFMPKPPQPEDSHLKPEYIEKYGNGKIFVETGTYLGQTVELMQRMPHWNEINSIEIDEGLYKEAKNKFVSDDKVKIWLGDSAQVLKSLVDHIEEPATFWLDAHPSGPLRGTGISPVLNELQIILSGKRKDHTIFIDDKRLFGSQEWGGITLQDAMSLIEKINPSYNVYALDGEIPQDILCFSVK